MGSGWMKEREVLGRKEGRDVCGGAREGLDLTYLGSLGNAFAENFDFNITQCGVECHGHY